ncbi:uncharacterized protein LOC134813024 [Bolinopsis microptera]|uniref:uncharacterized protein LOC134813024 n=1 Tax=Bolinopsis microptera TaxID=2820187 RepID=UPI00307A766C
MAVLVSTDSLNIQESDVFYLVSRWYEYDQVKRGSYISELLFNIRYHLMSKEQLVGPVYDWISAAKGLEDDTKLRLLIKINKFMKVPGLVALNNTNHVFGGKGSSKKLSRKLTGDDETLLQLIVHSVQYNNSARCADSKQLMKVLRESYPRANPTDKAMRCRIHLREPTSGLHQHYVSSPDIHSHKSTRMSCCFVSSTSCPPSPGIFTKLCGSN